MASRKKKQAGWDTYDNYDDFMDAMKDRGDDSGSADVPDVEKISLRDFVIPEKVAAFVNGYEPCDEFDPGAERFGDAELRVYFKAYVTGLGDPLALYIEDLKLANPPFRMQTSLADNKPAIFVKRKFA